MTGPDDDRLRAAIARLETCGRCHHVRHDGRCQHKREIPPRGVSICLCPAPQQPPVSLSQQRRLDVQQPPAQEREEGVRSFLTWLGAQGWRVRDEEGRPVGMPSKLLVMWRAETAPPSEADSAGEDERTRILVLLSTLFGTGHSWPRSGQTREEMTEANIELVCQFMRNEAALAASSGVRGGDDQAHAATNPAALAASSGVRGGDDQARKRLADVLALHVEMPTYDGDGRMCNRDAEDWPCSTVRAAGGGQP